MSNIEITELRASSAMSEMLSGLLIETVANGGSVGFMHPLQPETADALSSHAVANAGFAQLFKPPYLSLVVLFMIFNLCQAFGVYGFANWVPALLVEKGITVTKSLQYSFIIAFAYPIAPCWPQASPTGSSANGSSVVLPPRSARSGWRSRNSPNPRY